MDFQSVSILIASTMAILTAMGGAVAWAVAQARASRHILAAMSGPSGVKPYA